MGRGQTAPHRSPIEIMEKQGWQTRKLSDVCDFLNRGISPKYLETGGVCVLNQKCIRNHKIHYEPSRRHDLSAKKVGDGRFIQLGDVLVNSTGTGTLGRVAQVREHPTEPTTVDSHITIVRPKAAMFHLDFFGYMMIAIEDAIKKAGEGCGGQTELARSTLAEKFSITFPESPSEQRRIVAILDETLKGIAAAKANTERSLQNARDIFESQLNLTFVQHRQGWQTKTLGEVCEIVNGGTPKTGESEYWDGNHLWITPAEMGKRSNPYVSNTERKITETGLHNSSAKMLPPNSVILSSRAPIGYLVINTKQMATNQGCKGLIPDSQLQHKFLYYYLSSIVDLLNSLGTGATFKELSGGRLKEVTVPIPPLSEQKEIVIQLEALSTEILHLESIYRSKLTALEELKKSLLAHAFSEDL